MLVLLLALVLVAAPLAAQRPPSVAFTIPESDLIPEGIAWDPRSRSLFVSSTYRRKIVRIDSLGRAADFVREGQDGLWGVVGMRVDAERGVLWAASSDAGVNMPIRNVRAEDAGRSGVFKYELATGRLVRKYLLPATEDHFLNDLVVVPGGDLYVSDSRAKHLYRIVAGADTLEPFLPMPTYPNGIDLTPDGRALVVALESSIGIVDLARRTVRVLEPPARHRSAGGFDGLYAHASDVIAVQPWDTNRVVVRYRLDAERSRIVGSDVIVATHAALEQPTTAALAGNELFLVANSHLQTFRRLFESRPTGPWPELRPVAVLRASLQ